MSEKNKNETIEQQRRAREEFLKLKKIQQGELPAEPKPSDVAIVPKTREEKLSNFWFHHKWHVIALVFITVVLSILISQCATRTTYDTEVIYFTYTPVLDEQLEKVSEYFEKYATDLDGDGEVNVQVINCSVSNEAQNAQYRNVQLQKMQSLMVADEKALLFITDKDSITYFDNGAIAADFFVNEPLPFNDKFYEYTKSETLGSLPEGLQISCRKFEGTLLEKNPEAKASFESAQKILEKINE